MRLRLDAWDEEHTELLVRLGALPEVTRFIGPGTPWPREQAEEVAARARAQRAEHGFGWRAAYELAAERYVGLMSLNFAGDGAVGVDASEYEIGWWLEPSAWGRGLATEGAAAIRDEAFALGAPSVIARIHPANAASLALAARIGMTYAFTTTGRTGDEIHILRGLASAP